MTVAPHSRAQGQPLACKQGQWGGAFNHDLGPSPKLNAIHMALLHTENEPASSARVLVWGFRAGGLVVFETHWSVVHPEAPNPFPDPIQILPMPPGEGDLFCSGHSWNRDGKVIVFGGTKSYTTFAGGRMVWEFTPLTQPPFGVWAQKALNMAVDRWYPQATYHGDDKAIVAGGEDPTGFRHHYEAWNGTNWDSFGGGQTLYDGPLHQNGVFLDYPRLLPLSTGGLFNAGMSRHASKATHTGLGHPTWTIMDDSGAYRSYGCAVLQPRPAGMEDVAVILGGGSGSTTTNTVKFCYAGRQQPGPWNGIPGGWDWSSMPPVNAKRTLANAVLLPTREILMLGGKNDSNNFVKPAELFSGDGWTLLAAEQSPRGYHSSAVLLPSGRILHGGGDSRTHDYELYTPWYITCGGVRPVIQTYPAQMFVGNPNPQVITFQPMAGVTVDRAVLMRAGSCTHHFDTSQRYVELVRQGVGNNSITVVAPASSSVAPRGWYLLFLVSSVNVPSEAVWVNVQ